LALLFVYGTLLPWAPGALGAVERADLRAQARDLGRATTHGHLVDLGGYPGLVDGVGLVHGLLYDLIANPSATLTWLDAYEGVTGALDDEYARCVRCVTCADGISIDAWVYMYRHAIEPTCVRPSGRWAERR
jgi:gamma-glutamylcyclotransferase (GGCT)/AIG2-like uncharacterized protein YtfP